MSRLFFGFVFALMLSRSALAQAPKVEFFGGYQYTHFAQGDDFGGKNAHGWDVAFQANFNRVFGIKADFSGAYRTDRFSFPGTLCPSPFCGPSTIADISAHQYHYLFGPVLSARTDKATIFAHALFGAASRSREDFSETSFAMAFGGGLDYNLNKNFAVRVGQFDYLPTRFGSDTQNNFRYSTGIVFKF
jgi:opacity protein-like surface antigen